MRNTRIDMIRRNSKFAQQTSLSADDIWQIEEEDSGPVVHFQRYQTQSMVSEAMKKLPVDQQNALREVYIKGKSHTEAATDTGIPLGTIKSRVRMGLQKVESIIATRLKGDAL